MQRKPGVPTKDNPRTGAYKELFETGHDLHEVQALMAPRPFLVSGGFEDPPARWPALNRVVEVNELPRLQKPRRDDQPEESLADRAVERANLFVF